MKSFLLSMLACFAMLSLVAQQPATFRSQLPQILLEKEVSLHILSPEPISYVDISSNQVIGDLPQENVLRLKWKPDSVAQGFSDVEGSLGVLTVVGESFMAQYELSFSDRAGSSFIPASYSISPEDIKPLVSMATIPTSELRKRALTMLSIRRFRPLRKVKAHGVNMQLNAVYTVGDLVLLDITATNSTNLSYEIDQVRMKIEDRKITKATNVQAIEVEPIWQLYGQGTFKRSFRNIYVLKKMTFPANKILHIQLSEKQLSGRTLDLKVKYKDILEADTF
ncbi:conjugative transposon protein TraN [Sphingobacterium bambusae]|uniref:Conjugative transposon protein TraN n=1 Tax=Sphingobacterium bambusae TaxID=662858 RepID=A0ABW6BLF6_9SPHI|nr:conjugative transposon protein TraN [Sphingobacterium bambusae]WPL49377.1 conjugative transposon protein TraN [Sphingobacterium bambusae]